MLRNYWLVFSLLFFLACNTDKPDRLTIATAANVQFAMSELTALFTAETGIETEVILSSSGKLTAQIMQGAPYDLFLSANMKYPLELEKNGKTTEKPQVYAYGGLVIWSLDTSIELSLSILTSPEIRKIAIANPKTAPYGEAALSFFKHLNIDEQVREKLVYGESIAQTNQFIISGAAELGLTAKSVVRSPEMEERGQWLEVPPEMYQPIAQGLAIVNPDREKDAKAFLNFLSSESAQKILVDYGYRLK